VGILDFTGIPEVIEEGRQTSLGVPKALLRLVNRGYKAQCKSNYGGNSWVLNIAGEIYFQAFGGTGLKEKACPLCSA